MRESDKTIACLIQAPPGELAFPLVRSGNRYGECQQIIRNPTEELLVQIIWLELLVRHGLL